MTLAVACLTPEFVTLVIDRRLTQGAAVVDDFATKMVVICDRGAVGYSGLAVFPGGQTRMDDWIVQTLAKAKVGTLSDAAKVLREEGTKAFRTIRYPPQHKRHAFFIAGWSVTGERVRHPVVSMVSNALDDNWDWKSTADDEFRQEVFIQEDPKKFSLSSVGVPLPAYLLNSLRRALRRGFPRGLGAIGVIRLCVRAIRAVADGNSLVGADLLAVCIPPCSLTAGPRLMLAGRPAPGAVTFTDLRQPFERGRWAGPHFVCAGSAATNVEVGSLPRSP